jgi:hypothetical protein
MTRAAGPGIPNWDAGPATTQARVIRSVGIAEDSSQISPDRV